MREISLCKITPERLFIDPQAGIIEDRHRIAETNLKKRIGSTGKGVRVAIAEKVLRTNKFRLARGIDELQEYLRNVSHVANEVINSGGKVFIEGT